MPRPPLHPALGPRRDPRVPHRYHPAPRGEGHSRPLLGLAMVLLAACGDDPITTPQPGDGAPVEPVTRIAVPPLYGVHDMHVRDGLAFVCVWNAGLEIYDVGHGVAGGTPEAPVLVSSLVTAANGLAGARAHNAWWFHDPATGSAQYVFVGQEGPGSVGANASGDIHVVDVSDLHAPVEVASFHLAGAGTHNFWVDEGAAILYAAYYNGGVIGLDVSGTLSGDLASRQVLQLIPGGDDTYVWGVMLHRGTLYASDMLDGLYQLPRHGASSPAMTLGAVNDRFTSDVWLHGDWGYTGTWGDRVERGDALHIWRLDAGAPDLRRTLLIPEIGTVGDVEVSRDGRRLLLATERGPRAGMYVFDVETPDVPVLVARHLTFDGVHTATFGYVAGRTYVFAAKNPPEPAVLIFDVTDF